MPTTRHHLPPRALRHFATITALLLCTFSARSAVPSAADGGTPVPTSKDTRIAATLLDVIRWFPSPDLIAAPLYGPEACHIKVLAEGKPVDLYELDKKARDEPWILPRYDEQGLSEWHDGALLCRVEGPTDAAKARGVSLQLDLSETVTYTIQETDTNGDGVFDQFTITQTCAPGHSSQHCPLPPMNERVVVKKATRNADGKMKISVTSDKTFERSIEIVY